MFQRKQDVFMVLICVFLFVFVMGNKSFGYTDTSKITKITISKKNVNMYSIGRPVIKKYNFERNHDKFFILSVQNSILIGKGRVIPTPFPSVLKLIVTQFKTSPDIVHIVIKETSLSHYFVKVTHINDNRYVTTIYPFYNLKVFIDAGHGGNDPGGIGPSGLPESFVNLTVALELKKLLENRGIGAKLDRVSNHFVSLPDRVKKVKESDPNLFIGLYCNASKDKQLCGTTTYYFHKSGYPFAEYLAGFVSHRLGTRNDGAVKDNLYVIKYVTKIPAVLIEYAYISNRHEEQLLASSAFRHRLALSIANAICDYYILHKTEVE